MQMLGLGEEGAQETQGSDIGNVVVDIGKPSGQSGRRGPRELSAGREAMASDAHLLPWAVLGTPSALACSCWMRGSHRKESRPAEAS